MEKNIATGITVGHLDKIQKPKQVRHMNEDKCCTQQGDRTRRPNGSISEQQGMHMEEMTKDIQEG